MEFRQAGSKSSLSGALVSSPVGSNHARFGRSRTRYISYTGISPNARETVTSSGEWVKCVIVYCGPEWEAYGILLLHMCDVARGEQEVPTIRASSRLGLDKIMGYFENTRFPRLADSGTSADTVDA